MKIAVLISCTLSALALLPVCAANPLLLSADFAQTNGTIRALNGVNKGPIAPGGLVDVTKATSLLKLSSTRLHDCHWPTPDVVDFHAVFPNFDADPSKPESYDFRLTDQYIAAILSTHSEIIFRLGQSIEHTKVKRYVHPPKDMHKWADICLGIIRHYNEGWANGRHDNIKYWEIWNEPENRPTMWSGTDDDYYRLYSIASQAIKARYPDLKVGGPAVGYSGKLVNGELQATGFVTNFLQMCRRDSLPLDFFSWHCYTDDTTELTGRCLAVRKLLDSYGFTKAESHLNEWNYYVPNADESTPEKKEAIFANTAGATGATFVTASILEMQDSPVDVCNLFHGEIGALGIFSEHGVRMKNYYALLAFRHLLDHPQRVKLQGAIPGKLAMAAGLNSARTEATVLISNYSNPQDEVKLTLSGLPWTAASTCEIRLVDATHNLEPIGQPITASAGTPLSINLKAPAIALVTLRPAATPAAK